MPISTNIIYKFDKKPFEKYKDITEEQQKIITETLNIALNPIMQKIIESGAEVQVFYGDKGQYLAAGLKPVICELVTEFNDCLEQIK